MRRKVKIYGRNDAAIVTSLEAVQSAFLLALFVSVVEGSHASLEMGALCLNTKTSVALFFNCLKGVACSKSLLAHGIDLLFKANALLPVLVQVALGFLT